MSPWLVFWRHRVDCALVPTPISPPHPNPEVCLDELNRADVFVGFLGSKYGPRLPSGRGERAYPAPPDPEHDWLLEYPAGRGMLDVESARVALNRTEERSPTVSRVLYYERDNSFLSSVLPPVLPR